MPTTLPNRTGRPAQRPELFLQMAERMPSHNTTLAQACRNCAAGYQELVQTRAQLEKDRTRTEGSRLVALAKVARKKVLPLMDALDAASARVAEAQAHYRSEMQAIYDPKNKSYETCMRHAEVRAIFRAMPRDQVLNALEAARQHNDEDTLIALASVQPLLSGLPPQMHQHTRDHLVGTKLPQHAEVVKSLDEQAGEVAVLRAELLQSISDMIPFEEADAIVEAAKIDMVEG